MQSIVIVGAGFAGMYAALSAARLRDEQDVSPDTLEIAVVAPEPRLVIRPRLYERAPATMVGVVRHCTRNMDPTRGETSFDVRPPHLLPFCQGEATVTQEISMAQWVKTDLPEPVIRELEVLIRMAQALMGQPKTAEAPEEKIELGQYPGKVIGSL
jgi:hypothetical protein